MSSQSLASRAVLSAVALMVCGAAYAAEPVRSNSVAPDRATTASTEAAGRRQADAYLRSSTISGVNVKNGAGENIGSIEDLVIDTTTGRITYAALGFGGVLGIGEKLFAVPWSQLRLRADQNDRFFVLDVSKDALKSAPGFDKSHWPDFADPNFTQRIEHYYRDAGNTGHKVSAQ